MRRNLRPEDLGDLLDRPLSAVLGIHRQDGSVLLTPVWHLFKDGSFSFQIPGGDRKIALLEHDPRCTLLISENEFPYRGIEARGVARMSADDYAELGSQIVGRYVTAYDPDATAADYLLDGGIVVHLEAATIRAWDYADSAYV